jgi:adenosylhomocysteine nucleosidase
MSGRGVVVLTALNVEYDAVRERLDEPQVRRHPAGTQFEVGHLDDPGHQVALGLVGKGNHSAAVLAERAIAEFSPLAVLFVGVAGALRTSVALGDVVVATHVYAYHGGTSEDDGAKSRPRVWEAPHGPIQIAQHLARSGAWARRLPGEGPPKVHFGPIAAGEVVQDSDASEQARWIREHYNDALAIEMEAAGVAQAGHLNDSLPTIVVRGASDRADGAKASADRAGWQYRAAVNAAAFGLGLAYELTSGQPATGRGHWDQSGPEAREHGTCTNVATGNSRVGIQIGQLFGGMQIGQVDASHGDVSAQIAEFRRLLRAANLAGRIDEDLNAAAEEELDIAAQAAVAGEPQAKSKIIVALKRLYGLISDVAELGAHLATIIRTVQGV